MLLLHEMFYAFTILCIIRVFHFTLVLYTSEIMVIPWREGILDQNLNLL